MYVCFTSCHQGHHLSQLSTMGETGAVSSLNSLTNFWQTEWSSLGMYCIFTHFRMILLVKIDRIKRTPYTVPSCSLYTVLTCMIHLNGIATPWPLIHFTVFWEITSQQMYYYWNVKFNYLFPNISVVTSICWSR